MFVRNDRGRGWGGGPRTQCPSFIVIANGGTSAAAGALTLKPAFTYGEKGAGLEEKGKKARRRRDTSAARKGDGKERSRKGAEQEKRVKKAKAGTGNGIDVRSGYATSPRVQIGRCGPCRQLLSGPHFKTWSFNDLRLGSCR